MSSRVVLTPKAVGETKDYLVDFLSQLQSNEVIENATVTVSVYCGDDSTPNAMLSLSPRISGSTVTQRLTEGTRGVIYMLKWVAETDLLQIITIQSYLAVIDPEGGLSIECCTRIGNASSVNGKDFTISFPENPIPEYRDGLPLFVIFDNTATQAQPTLDADSLGSREIQLTESVDLSAYEILVDDVLQLVFDEDANKWILMGKIATQYALFAQVDQSQTLTTGEKFNYSGMPSMYILGAWAAVYAVSSSGLPTFDLNGDGSTMLSTKITIDVNEKSSKTAVTPPVFSTREFVGPWALSGDIDTAGTGATGWSILIKFRPLE